MRKTTVVSLIALLLIVLLAACTESEANNAAGTITALYNTVIAVSTETPLAFTQTVIESTPTLTATPSPQGTSTADTTPSTGACDQASLVADVTIPENTTMSAGQTFIKTWRLKNTGTCTWTTAYSVVFDNGYRMDSVSTLNFSSQIAPNQTVDISVTMRAPDELGTYIARWKLRNASGDTFGVGTDGTDPFSVRIIVAEPTITWTPTGTKTPTITKTPNITLTFTPQPTSTSAPATAVPTEVPTTVPTEVPTVEPTTG